MRESWCPAGLRRLPGSDEGLIYPRRRARNLFFLKFSAGLFHKPRLDASSSCFAQELPHSACDLVDMRFQSKVSRVEKLDCCVWDVATERLRARGTKYGSCFPQIASSGGVHFRKYS
jgi:hypothetical protein